MAWEKYSLERSPQHFWNYYHSKCSTDKCASVFLTCWSLFRALGCGQPSQMLQMPPPSGCCAHQMGNVALKRDLVPGWSTFSLQAGQHLVECGSVLAPFGISRDWFDEQSSKSLCTKEGLWWGILFSVCSIAELCGWRRGGLCPGQ